MISETPFPFLRPGARIGLFGGSFDPPHEGHLHASRAALRRLRLDQVWWLVAPQNPLKAGRTQTPLPARLAAARALARDPRILVTDLEDRLGTRYTRDTLRALARRYPKARFVLIIGADNFADLQRWQGWTEIMRRVPIAVVARPGYERKALTGPAALRFAAARLPAQKARRLADRKPPIWVFLEERRVWTSSTALRASQMEAS